VSVQFEDLSVAFCSEALKIQTAEYIQLWDFRASGHEVVVYTEELYLLLNVGHMTN